MGIYVIRVPDIGEGIAEVELVAWHVQPGDVVAEDQPIADVMTDKATVEIPSPVAGKVLALGTPRLVVALHRERAVRLHAAQVAAGVVERIDLGLEAAVGAVEDVVPHRPGDPVVARASARIIRLRDGRIEDDSRPHAAKT